MMPAGADSTMRLVADLASSLGLGVPSQENAWDRAAHRGAIVVDPPAGETTERPPLPPPLDPPAGRSPGRGWAGHGVDNHGRRTAG